MTEFNEAMETLNLADATAPEDLAANSMVMQTEIWKAEHKEYGEKQKAYANFRSKMYSVVLGQ